MLDCLGKNIIGLSDTECDCIENPNGIDYNTSDSGLFITDLIDVNDVSMLKDCKGQEVWKLLSKVRDYGRSKFNSNLERIVSKNFNKPNKNCTFSNKMYSLRYNAPDHTGTYGWKGVEIVSKNGKGTKARVEKIVSYFKATGVTEVFLYKSDDLVNPMLSIDVTVDNFKVVNDIDNVILDLYSSCSTCGDLKYYFIYESLIDNKDNGCFCGCAGGRCYSEYVTINGVYFTDLEQFQRGEVAKRNSYCNGLEFYIDFYCDWQSEICEDEEPNYESGIHKAFAEAIQYESVLYMLTILDSKSVLKDVFSYNLSFKNSIEGYRQETYSYIIDYMKNKDFNCLDCKASVKHT